MPEQEIGETSDMRSELALSLPPRVVIENVHPEVDAGRFPVKRVAGESVIVTANIHADGHNAVAPFLLYRHNSEERWHEVSMTLRNLGLDLWEGQFETVELGVYEYTLQAWIDNFANWKRDTRKKMEAGQSISLELLEGALLVDDAAKRASSADRERLLRYGRALNGPDPSDVSWLNNDRELDGLMLQHGNRHPIRQYDRILKVMVEPERARYGAWYEMFPRSCSKRSDPLDKHGTFKDLRSVLSYVAGMGFDVLYLPPIHPIAQTGRKGPNNALTAGPNDPGSPWAIGALSGGHKDVHPQLGTLDDFDELVQEADKHGIDIALDIAFQCSPDHPYVREHPEWFYHRPDGSIRCAENPPKKYEDIYPLDLACEDWRKLWQEMTDVVLFWVGHGVKIFRVDNPHTKPYEFWTHLIHVVKTLHPEVIFLAEAFTRPPVMKHLAKCGFSQSYTYFTWRNTKAELVEYLTELTRTEVAEYFRPNLFVNTPDILHEYLQFGGRPAFIIRLALAATLGASYGIYGPPFELCISQAIPGTEEYQDSEKYQLRHWDLDAAASIASYIGKINEIRRQNQALHYNRNLQFVPVDNDQIIAYIKASRDNSNVLLVVANLDSHHVQSGSLQIPVQQFGLEHSYQVRDLLTGSCYLWHGDSNSVELDPKINPVHIFQIEKKVKSEQDFEQFA